jgi:hypothetical protein
MLAAKQPVGDLDENGFYGPGGWTVEQLREFGRAVDPQIDIGIVRAVKVLSDAGIETFESCEVGPGHSMPYPTVRFHGLSTHAEGWRALAICLTYGLPVLSLKRYWDVNSLGEPSGPRWEIEFRRKLL